MRPLPFPVKAWFDCFILLIYAVDKEKAEALLPYPLQHDSHKGKAIMAAAFVKTRKFRPAFLPGFVGTSFSMVGYRHMASFTKEDGKSIRGLKIIESASSNALMAKSGNRITQYKFTYNPLEIKKEADRIILQGDGINIKARAAIENAKLPPGSIFENWQYARKFAGPLLYTFELEAQKNKVVVTEGSRHGWTPKPLEIDKASLDFFEKSPYAEMNPILSAAYIVENIPYRWEKAVRHSYT